MQTTAEQLRGMAQDVADPMQRLRLLALAHATEELEARVTAAEQRATDAEMARLMHRCGSGTSQVA